MGYLSIFLDYSSRTRQVNEISDSISQIITFGGLSNPTSIVYFVFYLFW